MYKQEFLIILSLFLISLASAMPQVTVTVNPSFKMGDQVAFDYSIVSDRQEYVEYRVGTYCGDDIPMPFIQFKNATLQPNVPIKDTFDFGIIDDNYNPGICNASVIISKHYLSINEKPFSLDLQSRLPFSVNLCRDSSCNSQTTVFLKGNKVYILLSSDANGVSNIATLTAPDGKVSTFSLPKTLTADQIGAYSLEVNASKSGYRDGAITKQFGVIAGNAVIPYVGQGTNHIDNSTSANQGQQNSNNQTNSNSNTPANTNAGNQTLASDNHAPKSNILDYITIGIIILALAIILVYLFRPKMHGK